MSDDTAPPGDGEPRFRYLRLAAVLAVIVLAVVAGVAILNASLDPTEDQLRDQAGLTGRRDLLIGVNDDRPGLSYRNPKTGQYEGFEIDIAYLIAADLGFRPTEVKFYPLDSEKRHSMQALSENGVSYIRVDLVIASYSIKPERERLRTVSFSEPYLRTTQSVVTRKDTSKTIESLRDLRGESGSVCTLGTATSAAAAVEAGLDNELVERKKIHDCIDGLRKGRYEAVTTDAAIMAGWVDRYPDDLQHHDITMATNEEYGVNTGGKEALRKLVNLALYRTLTDPADGRWKDAYDEHLRPLERANRPQSVAEAQQPFLAKPPVREMPWDERVEGR